MKFVIIILLVICALFLCSCMSSNVKDCLRDISNVSCMDMNGSVGILIFGEEFYYSCYFSHDMVVLYISPEEYNYCSGKNYSNSNKVNLTGMKKGVWV